MNEQDRLKIKMLKNQFEAANLTDKTLKNLDATINISADAKVLDDLPILRSRSEYMYNNYAIAKKIINTVIKYESNYKIINNSEIKEISELINIYFKEFSKNVTYDKLNLDEFFDLYKRTILLTGDCFVIFYNDSRLSSKFKTFMEIPSSNKVFTPLELIDFKKYRVKNGIQLSEYGEPIGFYLLNYELNDVFNNQQNGFGNVSGYSNTYNKPLEDFTYIPFYDDDGTVRSLHLFKKEFPGQTRGIPYLSTVIKEIHTLKDYRQSEWVRRRVASLISLAITSNNPVDNAEKMLDRTLNNLDSTSASDEELMDAVLEAEENKENKRYQSLRPGGIMYLEPGQSVSTVDLGGIEAGVYESWLNDSISNIAAGVSIPKFIINESWEDINYTSGKSGFNNYKKEIENNQEWDNDKLISIIYEKFINEISFNDPFNKYDKLELNKFIVFSPQVPDVDTFKETQSNIQLIENNLMTRSEYFTSKGQKFEDIINKLKYEKELMEQAGISTLIGSQIKETKPIQEDVETDEENNKPTKTNNNIQK